MAPGAELTTEHSSGCVLETEIQGQTNLVVCRNSYSVQSQSQSWLLFTAHSLASGLTTSGLQKTEQSPDARRQLIMELAVAEKSSREVGEVLELMYGSRVPASIPNATSAIRAERVQQILELLAGRVSVQRVGDFLEMMYGTSAPL
ncbi:hypothetical protein PR001_g28591 [Phytophthora rubi]|uniref:Uncharacterized protein n=1 Tax=Phytophthora rubi TaxID=129364 RepID=A0A6A3H8S9_9STRA|nr:hypothetical protein PR002_g28627 [Phytophthora rubi]KAE8965878.1 hypothetical protein PR001_g28591 [Phytophthora rubi]